jgi:hypothetical protein
VATSQGNAETKIWRQNVNDVPLALNSETNEGKSIHSVFLLVKDCIVLEVGSYLCGKMLLIHIKCSVRLSWRRTPIKF